MGVISKTVSIKSNMYMKKYYEDKGYVVGKRGTYFIVKIEDLPNTSNAIIDVKCDYCGHIFQMKYMNYTRNKNNNKISCLKCKSLKAKETNIKKYGCENPMQDENIKTEFIDSIIEKYGVKSTSLIPEVRAKQIKTCLERYNCKTPLSCTAVQEKIKQTNIEKYGCDNAMKNKEIQKKVRASLYKNQTVPASKAQLHLCKILNGDLNFNIGYYNVDILLNNNIYVEYDGGGHDLNVRLGNVDKSTFLKKENIRYHYLKKCGYKMIRLINISDKLPTDSNIILIIKYCIEFLTLFNDNWIEIDLDTYKIKVKNDN